MSEPIAPPPPPSSMPPPPPAAAGGSNKTLMLVLSYLGLLAIIPFVVEKDDKEVQWHAKHGIVLLIAWAIVWAVLMVLGQLGVLACLAAILAPLLGLGWLVVTILCIMKAVNGQRFIIPGLSQYADKF